MDLTNLATTSAAGIASSTSGYLEQFSSLFFMIIGLVFAMVVIEVLISLVGGGRGSLEPSTSDAILDVLDIDIT